MLQVQNRVKKNTLLIPKGTTGTGFFFVHIPTHSTGPAMVQNTYCRADRVKGPNSGSIMVLSFWSTTLSLFEPPSLTTFWIPMLHCSNMRTFGMFSSFSYWLLVLGTFKDGAIWLNKTLMDDEWWLKLGGTALLLKCFCFYTNCKTLQEWIVHFWLIRSNSLFSCTLAWEWNICSVKKNKIKKK